MPFCEVITLFPVPVPATAQNRLSDGTHTIEFMLLLLGVSLIVQAMPFGDVIILCNTPELEPAQNRLSSGDHAMHK